MSNHFVRPGDTVQFGTAAHVFRTPPDIATFLGGRGWLQIADDHWQKSQQQMWEVTWEQAMAYEFYMFITLGGK